MTKEELISEIKKADGPSRKLDREIHLVLFPELRGLPVVGDAIFTSNTLGVAIAHDYTRLRQAWTAFIKDNWRWEMHSDGSACVYIVGKRTIKSYVGEAQTPELAFCIAMISAIKDR